MSHSLLYEATMAILSHCDRKTRSLYNAELSESDRLGQIE